MRQRGRKSAANLVALNVTGTSPKLVAPAYLRDDERTLFVELIGACSPNHFVESDSHRQAVARTARSQSVAITVALDLRRHLSETSNR
jgi:hypothetical protein